MFSRQLQLQRLNLGRKTIDMMRNQRNVFTHISVPPVSMECIFESLKRPYEFRIKLLEDMIGEQKADMERQKKSYKENIELLQDSIKDKKADLELQRDLMKRHDDKMQLLEGIIKDRKANFNTHTVGSDIRHKLDQFEIADLKYKYLRDTGKLNPYHVLEFISDSVRSQGFYEKVQSKLDRIKECETFKSALNELCAELMISESQAEQSRQDIFQWFWMHERAHPWEFFHLLRVNTDNSNFPACIAASLLAYLRWSNIKHSYVIRGELLDWPSIPSL
ncbi:hypothetical protein BGX38DRAFT_880252 [Terfezia claveryi]|nr:hypothetical protein BGX38DRAFT_880252 [Terfezia claveryi]